MFERTDGSGTRPAPVSIRMEAYPPVGGARWTVTAGPEGARAVIPSRRAYSDAPDLATFTAPLLGAAVGADEIVAILLGTGVPLPELLLPPGGGAGAGLAQEAGFEPTTAGVRLPGGRVIEWDADGQVRAARAPGYEASYPGAFRREGRRVPREIEIRTGSAESELAVEELALNAALHPDSFHLEPPPGFREVAPRRLADDLRLDRR